MYSSYHKKQRATSPHTNYDNCREGVYRHQHLLGFYTYAYVSYIYTSGVVALEWQKEAIIYKVICLTTSTPRGTCSLPAKDTWNQDHVQDRIYLIIMFVYLHFPDSYSFSLYVHLQGSLTMRGVCIQAVGRPIYEGAS